MARFGTGIQAGLGRIDYTPYLQGSMAGSQAIGRGIAGIGEAFGSAIQEYGKRKEERDLYQSTVEGQIGRLAQIGAEFEAGPKLPNQKNPIEGIDIKKYENLADFSTSKLKATSGELAALIARAENAPARALQAAQLEAINRQNQIEAQNIKNITAFTRASAATPTSVTETTTVPVAKFGQPKADITPFLYGGGVAAPQAGSGVLMAAPRMGGATAIPSIKTGKPTVENTPPPGVADFLERNMLTGKFEFVSDVANQKIQQREAELANERAIAGRIERATEAPTNFRASALGGPGPIVTTQPMLTDSQRIGLQNSLAERKKIIEAKTNELNQIKEQVSAAQKFSGQPISKPAEDPFISKGISVLRAPVGEIVKTIPSPDVFKKDVEKEVRMVEKEQNRTLTPNERLSILTEKYIAEGGQLTPKMADDFKKSVGADMQFGTVGGVQYVRIGDNVKFFDEKKPLSAAMVKEAKQDKYVEMLGAFADFISQNGADAFYSIPVEYRQILSNLHDRFGADEVDALGNKTGKKRRLLDSILEKAGSVYGNVSPGSSMPNPISPSAVNSMSGRTSSGLNFSIVPTTPRA